MAMYGAPTLAMPALRRTTAATLPRAPSLARPLHRCGSILPRWIPSRRLRLGHLRPLHHVRSPSPQSRARAPPRPMGDARRARFAPPRTPFYLRGNPPPRTRLVQSRSPDLLPRRSRLSREPFPSPRPIHPGDSRIPSPPNGPLRRIPPSRRPSRRGRRRPLPRRLLRPPRFLRRPRHPPRAPNERNQERSPRHAGDARDVHPSPRHRQRTSRQLARTPRGPLFRQRFRLRDEVRPLPPRQPPREPPRSPSSTPRPPETRTLLPVLPLLGCLLGGLRPQRGPSSPVPPN